jgi:hypothetical protein
VVVEQDSQSVNWKTLWLNKVGLTPESKHLLDARLLLHGTNAPGGYVITLMREEDHLELKQVALLDKYKLAHGRIVRGLGRTVLVGNLVICDKENMNVSLVVPPPPLSLAYRAQCELLTFHSLRFAPLDLELVCIALDYEVDRLLASLIFSARQFFESFLKSSSSVYS